MGKKIKKNILVLSGGGFLGSYEVGAINYINEHWKEITGKNNDMTYDIVAGVSVGSLNGVLVAQNKLNELNDLWNKVIANGGVEIFTSKYINRDGSFNMNMDAFKEELFPNFKISFGLIVKGGLNFFGRLFSRKIPSFMEMVIAKLTEELSANLDNFGGLGDNTPLKDKLTKMVKLSNFSNHTKFLCGFVSLDDGEYYSVSNSQFKSDEDLVNGVLASTSMPIVWPAVSNCAFDDKNPKNLIDGGVRNISPLGKVIELINNDKDDAEYNIFVINCHGNTIVPKYGQKWNIVTNAVRALHDITLSEIFRNDIERFIIHNELMEDVRNSDLKIRKNSKHDKYTVNKPYKLHIIQPEKEGILGNSLDTTAESITKRRRLGGEDAEKYFNLKTKPTV